jgi:hypothetical protein
VSDSAAQAPRLDETEAAAVVTRALALAGGSDLVLSALARLPGAVHAPARKSLFRSDPETVAVGHWRYRALPDGRLSAAHVVEGIVLADTALPAAEAGANVVGALRGLIAAHGPGVLPDVEAALAGLQAAAGP